MIDDDMLPSSSSLETRRAPRPTSSPAGPALGRTARLATVATAALIAACAASGPPPTLLTLPASAPSGSPPPDARLLVVRRVDIPEYLVSRHVRYRGDGPVVDEWPNAYWAERMEIGASRSFVSALRRELPEWNVCEGACEARPGSASLQLDLSTLDFVRSTRQLRTAARLTLTPADPAAPQVRTLVDEATASADSPEAQAEAIGAMLARCAAAAAQQARSLAAPQPH